MKFKLIYALIVLLSTISTGCRKGEGIGGKATITGKVYVHHYINLGATNDKNYYARDKDVFIIYGDNNFYDDKVATHLDGSYKFDYLMPGNYTVFTYSKDVDGSASNDKIVVLQEVTITDKKETVVLEDFEVNDD